MMLLMVVVAAGLIISGGWWQGWRTRSVLQALRQDMHVMHERVVLLELQNDALAASIDELEQQLNRLPTLESHITYLDRQLMRWRREHDTTGEQVRRDLARLRNVIDRYTDDQQREEDEHG